MKVLYVLWNYPQLSETYVTVEIAFAQAQGVGIEVWRENVQKEDVPVQCPVHSGSLEAAIASVRPDVVHMHYLVMAERLAPRLPPSIPVTVRAHSFDWDKGLAWRVTALPNVRRIFAFPHFARQVSHPKMRPMPVAYSTARFKPVPGPLKDGRMVLRLAAALPTKGLTDFFAAAQALKDHRFILGVAHAGGAPAYPETLKVMNLSGCVDLRFDVPWEEAAGLTAKAGIYMETSDPRGHAFGMPISIAEALATGSLVLVRRSSEAEEYLGSAGRLYQSAGEAVSLIRETLGWKEDQWAAAAAEAVARARAFADTTVLPDLVDEWRSAVERG